MALGTSGWIAVAAAAGVAAVLWVIWTRRADDDDDSAPPRPPSAGSRVGKWAMGQHFEYENEDDR